MKIVLAAVIFTTFTLLVFLQPTLVSAQAKNAIQNGVSQASNQDAASANPEQGVNNIIRNITRLFSYVIGAVSVIMIMYGGFRYVTAGGDSNAAATARKVIIYAAIGLVVAILAQIISRAVIGETSRSVAVDNSYHTASGHATIY